MNLYKVMWSEGGPRDEWRIIRAKTPEQAIGMAADVAKPEKGGYKDFDEAFRICKSVAAIRTGMTVNLGEGDAGTKWEGENDADY